MIDTAEACAVGDLGKGMIRVNQQLFYLLESAVDNVFFKSDTFQFCEDLADRVVIQIKFFRKQGRKSDPWLISVDTIKYPVNNFFYMV